MVAISCCPYSPLRTLLIGTAPLLCFEHSDQDVLSVERGAVTALHHELVAVLEALGLGFVFII